MSNREKREEAKEVHLLLAFARKSQGEEPKCIRHVMREDDDIEVLKSKLKVLGGYWRIHRTVNARDVEKARIWLLHDLLDHPEHAAYVDTQWRTALLQTSCKTTNYFMLDIDTQDEIKIKEIEQKCLIKENIVTQKMYDKSKGETWGHLSISNYLFSACCNADVIDCAGIYVSTGNILDGYECTKCGKHLYELKDFKVKNGMSTILQRIKSPKGWHYITEPFDTREVCKFQEVTLLRDGYYFVCEVGERKI